MARVAIVFDNTHRSDTTGIYCHKALIELVRVGRLNEFEHFLPGELEQISPGRFDLYLYIDDGLIHSLRADLRPALWWAIDTHVGFERCLNLARQADLTFAAQRNGTACLREAGIRDPQWLPLACDPEIHGRRESPTQYDIAFVGHVAGGPRAELLRLLQSCFEKHWCGQCTHLDMAGIYSASRTVFNRSVLDDVNMRVFEGLCSGSLLVTNDLAENGQEELLTDGVHCVTYRDADELLDKLRFYLTREDLRQRIAAQGRNLVLEHHTYLHRMLSILDRYEQLPHRARTVVPATLPKDQSYFEFSRPELLELVPVSARRVLDIGCGGGRLGESIKRRQQSHVIGVELNPRAASLARHRLDEVIDGDIQSAEVVFPSGSFDCVICADILEHVRDPQSVLRRIRNWLTPEGLLLTSIPNVQNHTVIRSLLEGNWTYESAGLLDEDHVRFFTRREIEKLFYRCGFEIRDMRMVGGEGFADWQRKGSPHCIKLGPFQLRTASTAEAEAFFAYQYLTVAAPVERPDVGLTSIIVVTHNQFVHTKTCLDSIRTRTDEPYEIIVVDNASTDGTIECLRQCEDVRLLTNTTNRGFPAAANQGIQVAQGEQLLLLNNDTVVTTGWLGRLLRALQASHSVGLVGPVSNNVSGAQQVPVQYDDLAQLDGFAWDWGKRHERQTVRTDRLVGFCLLVKRAVFEQIGLLDERFGIGNFEDDDVCRRAGQAGYELVIAQDAFVHHIGSATFRGMNVSLADILQKNHRKYLDKWNNTHDPLVVSRASESEADPAAHLMAQDRGTSTVSPHIQTSSSSIREKLPALGCVLAVRDRPPENVERTLQSFALQTYQPADRILVDESSRAELHEAYRALCNRFGWRIIRLSFPDGPLNLSRAYNTAVGQLHRSVEVVYKSDVDVLLSSTVLERAARNGACCLYLFQCVTTTAETDWMAELTDESLRQLAVEKCVPMEGDGLHAFPRGWFESIGGYDTEYRGWGFEDSDLRLRAERSIGIRRDWETLLIHQWHPRRIDYVGASRNHAYFRSTMDSFTLVRNAGTRIDVDLPGEESPVAAGGTLATPALEQDVMPQSVQDRRHPQPQALVDVNSKGSRLLKSNTIRLSACLIVRDNERTIGPCLESLKPWVDEIVVVDTGSADRTPQICEELGARVFYWAWQDSFSAARNESLRYARGEWLFWMDSDDTIPEQCGRKLRALAAGDHPSGTLGYVMQVHCPGNDPQDVTVVDHVKLIRNRDDLRFEFRIHEQILPAIRRAGGDVQWTDIYVVHSGSDRTPEGRVRKLERDFRLLELDLKERPDHPFVLFNLGMTLSDAGRSKEAIDHLERCVQVSGPTESHLRKTYALLASSCMQLREDARAEAACRDGLRRFPADKELLFRLAMIQHRSGQLEDAAETYTSILDRPMNRYFMSIDAGVLGYKAHHNLAIVLEELGRHAEAAQHWSIILKSRPNYEPARVALARLKNTVKTREPELLQSNVNA